MDPFSHLRYVFPFPKNIFFPWTTSNNLRKGKILQSKLNLFPAKCKKELASKLRYNTTNQSQKKNVLPGNLLVQYY